jgi:hypothetical protein
MPRAANHNRGRASGASRPVLGVLDTNQLEPRPPLAGPAAQLPVARRPLQPRIDISHHLRLGLSSSCPHCGALHWIEELAAGSSPRNPVYSSCCAAGAVTLPSFAPPPPVLRNLLVDPSSGQSTSFPALRQNCTGLHLHFSSVGREYRDNIRSYNNALALCSVGMRMDRSVWGPQGVFSFRIQGAMHHLIGSFLPEGGTRPMFSQIYVTESNPHNQVQHRLNATHGQLNAATLLSLQNMLHEVNPYVEQYLTARERMELDGSLTLHLISAPERNGDARRDARRYNRPTASEVGIVIVEGASEGNKGKRDIIVQCRLPPVSWLLISDPQLTRTYLEIK